MTTDTSSTSETEATAGVLGLPTGAALQELRQGVVLLLRKELGDFALADDLCNETFRVVLERLRRRPLADPAGLASFLAQTARFLAIAHRRTVDRRHTDTGHQHAIDGIADPAPGPEELAHTDACAAAVRRVLEEIPSLRDREILVRLFLHEQDNDQVCRELGIDGLHLRKVVFRAKERFRDLIAKRYRGSDLLGFAIA